ncbi:MAG: hypothetical protein D9V47_09605 [Clostridia bacterium]|nr:MAG: hypothetical protein D9V47_09605 [Clostridia bacterium]
MVRRKRLPKGIRAGVLLFVAVLLAMSIYETYEAYQRSKSIVMEVPAFKCEQEAKIDYRVYLRPNNLFGAQVLDSGKTYLANFVDRIGVFFAYRLSADREAKIDGTYDVVATAEAYDGSGDNAKKIWDKSFIIVPQKSFNLQGKSADVKENAFLDLAAFNSLIADLSQQSELTPGDARLVVRWNLHTNVTTPSGTVKEDLSPEMVVPMGRKSFEISGEMSRKKSSLLTTKEEVPDAALPGQRKTFLAASSVLAAILIALGLGTCNKTSASRGERDLQIIWKKHGERIVSVQGEFAVAMETAPVQSMDDLLKVADELGKPIIYQKRDSGKVHSFFVLDGSLRYEYLHGTEPERELGTLSR